MKLIKVWLILGLLALSITGILWVLKILNAEQSADYAGKTIGVIAILAALSFAVSLVSGKSKAPETSDSNSINKGPQF